MAPNLQFRVTKPVSRITSWDEARERLNNAIKAYEHAEASLFITQAARLYVVSKATLYCRINSRCDRVSYRVSKRRLTPEEEESIKMERERERERERDLFFASIALMAWRSFWGSIKSWLLEIQLCGFHPE